MSHPADPLVPMDPSIASEGPTEGDPAAAAPSESYDPVELRRRMAVCFSATELRELADSLGVTGQIAWDRGPSESARDLIKQFEKYYGLGILVTKLRALRPLVEWPEPNDPALVAAPIVTAGPSPGSATEARTLPFAPRVMDDPDGGGATIQDPLPSPPRPGGPRSRAAPAWPGTSAPRIVAKPEARGIDPRVLIVVAGLTVLAALIAYFAGRASRPPTAAAEAAGSASPVASAAIRRAPGPATHAADALRRSLDRVVRACDMPVGTDRDASILALALARCGFQVRTPVSALTPPLPDPPLAVERPDAPRPPSKTRPTKAAKDPAIAKDPATAKADACIGACDADRRSCNDHCGAEPTESSLYDGYMHCRSRCLSAASHCRLACP